MSACCEGGGRRRRGGAALALSFVAVVAVAAALKLLTGCSYPRPADVDPDAGQRCTSASDCSTPRSVCDIGGTNVCVECTRTMASACTGTQPVCDGTSCRGCTSHNECPLSDACLPDGSCAPETAVVYFEEGGVNGLCTKTVPCGEGIDAIKEIQLSRPYLRVTGTVSDGGMTIDNKIVTILGDSTAVLKRAGAPRSSLLDI
ncbi:MAG: hypothetical protein R3B07_37375 [Polyangiaceae bacterium]